MFEIVAKEATTCDLKELVQKLVPEAIGKGIEAATQGIYPLANVFVRKVKILKAPKFDREYSRVSSDSAAEVSHYVTFHAMLITFPCLCFVHIVGKLLELHSDSAAAASAPTAEGGVKVGDFKDQVFESV